MVELLVVLAIILTLTTVTLTSQGAFNKTLILANTAYDMALTLRSAETYGISSRAAGIDRNTGYGLHLGPVPASTFTLFADTNSAPGAPDNCHPTTDSTKPDAKPGNCIFDTGETVTDYALGNRIVISDYCAYESGNRVCASSDGLRALDIVFLRPNPDPFVRVTTASSAIVPETSACITITSSQGGARYVSITAAGAITAGATPCL